jgi:hypothetical protein
MELIVEPELYAPSINENGDYIDKVPASIKNGILCPCGSRKDKVYDNSASFSAHMKTKIHSRWLVSLNLNKSNFYTENIRLEELVKNQRIIIGKLEKELNTKSKTIDYLTDMLSRANEPIENIDLLTFD